MKKSVKITVRGRRLGRAIAAVLKAVDARAGADIPTIIRGVASDYKLDAADLYQECRESLLTMEQIRR